MAKAKKKREPKTVAPKESSRAFFERTRPKFLDWTPPTREDLRREAHERKKEREAELRRVTALENAKRAAKRSAK